MLVPLRKRAEAIADDLEQQHCKNTPKDGGAWKIDRGFLRKLTEEGEKESKTRQRKSFTDKELDEAIRLPKKGKAPGPHGVSMELIKWLSKDNRN